MLWRSKAPSLLKRLGGGLAAGYGCSKCLGFVLVISDVYVIRMHDSGGCGMEIGHTVDVNLRKEIHCNDHRDP